MARPTEQAAVVILVHGCDAEALVQLFRGDVVADGVCHGDPTHGAAARVVKGAKLGEEVLTEAPHLTPIEQDGQYEGRVHLAPEVLREGEVAQHAPQGAEGCRRRPDALVDVRVRRERVVY